MRYLGTWLLDLASSLPPPLAGTNEFVGTDLNPAHFPNPAPPNVTFSIHDIKQPWPETQNSRFHLVHQRLTLLGAGPNPSASISHLYSIVKPGGWVRISQGTMDKKLANEGAETCGAAVQALSKFAQNIPPEKQPLPVERYETLAADLEKELMEKGAVYPLKVVWGRKPE